MSRMRDLDFKGIEKREWYFWSLAFFLIIVLGMGNIVAHILIIRAEHSALPVSVYRILSGLLFLVILFCLYVTYSRLRYGRVKDLLIEMSGLLSSTVELDILLLSFAKTITRVSHVTFCQIALLLDDKLILKTAHAARPIAWTPEIGKSYNIARMPIINKMIQAPKNTLIDCHILTQPDVYSDDIELLTGGAKGGSDLLILPIIIQGKTIGILILGEIKRFNRNRFPPSEVLLIEVMAKHLTTAINRAALTEEAQKMTESLLQTTLDSTSDGILVVDSRDKFISFNKQFVLLWKIPDSVVSSYDNDDAECWVRKQLKQPTLFFKNQGDPITSGEASFDDALVLTDGRVIQHFSRPQFIHGIMVGHVWSFRDVTEYIKVKSELERHAITDPLTGLYNRRYFSLQANKEVANAKRKKETIAVVLCDLNGFKRINDTKGHQEGDEVLKSVAQAIRDSMRASDMVFRWGGDEFLLVLPATNRDGMLALVSRVQSTVLQIGNAAGVPLSISIGMVFYPEHGTDMDELIDMADRALYHAKKEGDTIHIGGESYPLSNDTITTAFQPIVDMTSNQPVIIGYEALVRDVQGILSPMALFDKYQRIGRLMDLKMLCFHTQIAKASDLGIKRLFINVDFNLLNLLDEGAGTIKPPNLDVILEISEAEAIHDIEEKLKTVRRFEEKGYRFAIDDFGAGFISLSFVAKLLPDYIKLDRSVVLQAESSVSFRDFLKHMLRALGLYVKTGIVAEGIETDNEFQVMKELEIPFMQGFLFGIPNVRID